MKLRHKVMTGLSIAGVAIILGALFVPKIEGIGKNAGLKNQADTEYKISLNNSNNKLTLEEGGNWDNPKPENSPFYRLTSKGNTITFRHSGTRSLTSVDNNFCIARDSGGWFANETPLTGITKIEIQCQAGLAVRFDFGKTQPLNGYKYSDGIPEYVDYHTDELVGSSTYTVIPDSNYCYFRFQQITTGNNWINHIDIYYSCVAPCSHDWVHHDAVDEYHNHDGSIEYEQCSLCGAYRDMEGNLINYEDTIVKPKLYYLKKGTVELDRAVDLTNSGNTITLDFKFDDPNGSILLQMYSTGWAEGFGAHDMKISGVGLSSSYLPGDGVTYTNMTDGWIRITFDFNVISTWWTTSGVKLSDVKILYLQDKADTTTNAYCEIFSKATYACRGHYYEGAVDYTYELKSAQFVSFDNLIINVDILWKGKLDPTKNDYIRIMFAENWSDYYGYYELTKDTKDGDFDGITVSTCPDGYTRYTVNTSKCHKIDGTNLPSTLKFIYVHKWSNAIGWIDFSWSTHVHDFVKTEAVSPFRENSGNIEYYTCQDPLCGGIYDKNNNKITLEDTVLPSRLQRYESGSDVQYNFATPITAGNMVSVDFKPDDSSKKTCIALFETSGNWSNYRGYYSFFGNGSYEGTQEEGVSTCLLLDGYVRVTFDMTKLFKWNDKTASNGLSQVAWIYIRGNWTTTGGYVDFNVKGGTVARGRQFTGTETTASDVTINFDHSLARTSVVNVDVFYTSVQGTKISMCIGDWTNYNGYFNLFENPGLMDNIDGLTITQLDDGYVRYSFKLDELTKINNPGTIPSYNHVYIRGVWTTASGFIDVSYVENLNSPILEDIY